MFYLPPSSTLIHIKFIVPSPSDSSQSYCLKNRVYLIDICNLARELNSVLPIVKVSVLSLNHPMWIDKK